jgi:hypothetical protein
MLHGASRCHVARWGTFFISLSFLTVQTAHAAGPICPALLHLDDDDGFPDAIGEGGAAAVFGGFADAKLGGSADVEGALLAEGAEEAVEEDLRNNIGTFLNFCSGPPLPPSTTSAKGY